MKGVITSYAVYRNGVFKVVVECKDRESYELVKRKLRLIGIFVTDEKGNGFV